MSVRFDQPTGDLVIDGFDSGISSSPHKGIAAIKNANITTEQSEVMANFPRVQQTTTPFTGQTLTYLSSSTLTYTGSISFFGLAGTPITVGSGITGLSAGNYYINSASGTIGNQVISLSASYRGAAVTGMSAGSATFTSYNMGPPVASAIEKYYDGTNVQYRYYILASNASVGNVWVLDTGSNESNVWVPVKIQGNFNFPLASGIAVLNGYLFMFQFNSDVWVVETTLLGQDWQVLSVVFNSPSFSQLLPRFCLVGHAGTLNVTDGNFIATFIPNSSSGVGVANNFSYGTYTFSAYTLTLTNQISGDFPIVGQTITFTSSNGTLPTGLSVNTVYYVTNGTNSVYNPDLGEFSVSATVGGSAISLSGTPGGTQYFNSFNPLVSSTFTFDPAACTINSGTPSETAISLAELGNTLIIGTTGSTLYQWDEISPTWTNFIPLAETNASYLLTVNNVVFIFAGYKGNIYVTSGSAASGVLTVPDYLAGIPGSPSSYIEPYFVWGQAFFSRGRVFFSIQDQTSNKVGNCGGIYSFVPSFYNDVTGQDAGTALRHENWNSYATFNGIASVLLPNQNQEAIGVQYYSGWISDVTTPTYGIDQSGTTSSQVVMVETDLVPIGSYIDKGNFTSIQSRYASPLQSGESAQIKFRVNLTDAWSNFGDTTAGTDNTVGSIGARWPAPWANALQVQFQILLTPVANGSFVRFRELRLTKT